MSVRTTACSIPNIGMLRAPRDACKVPRLIGQPVVLAFAILTALGLAAASVWTGAAAHSILQAQVVSYIQHYNLRREALSSRVSEDVNVDTC